MARRVQHMIMLTATTVHGRSERGLDLAPSFLQDNPFFSVASKELEKLHTVRGLPLEFGDEQYPGLDGLSDRPAEGGRMRERRPSMNWPGFGIGLLRVGGPGHRQELFMTYDRLFCTAPRQAGDRVLGDGVPVMRDGATPRRGQRLSRRDQAGDPERPGFSLPSPAVRVRAPAGQRVPLLGGPRPLDAQHGDGGREGTGPGWEDNEGLGEMLAFMVGGARRAGLAVPGAGLP